MNSGSLMTLAVETRIGKKFAIYLPKAVVNALSLKEGEKLLKAASKFVKTITYKDLESRLIQG
jgi:antitoxin component of MazEF toxin-antitoxin module